MCDNFYVYVVFLKYVLMFVIGVVVGVMVWVIEGMMGEIILM